ncbi:MULTISPECIES: hypothetical protein [Streptomyces]|uniref:hypothetical protein n=1 Tax=Streptomyces TaxID=1883 RepID=UPI0011613DDC|nr:MULTISPECIES: hypothetical protein [unclassified Streptomyces]QNQ32452.1 hypothetical protein HYC88_01275 [Streptomyces sp. CB00271]
MPRRPPGGGGLLDALALCHGHGSYLPRPYQETSTPVPTDVELRTDASDVAGELARHDRQYGTSTTGNVPAPLEDGCTDSDRDAVRAYARREWITRQERWPGIRPPRVAAERPAGLLAPYTGWFAVPHPLRRCTPGI